MELQIIAACCSILHQSKNSSTISAPFNTFKLLSWLSKPFLLSPHACGPHATSCTLLKLIQWSLAPRQPLDYLNAHPTMPWNCKSLQHVAAFCTKARTAAPFQHHSTLSSSCPGFQSLSSCLLMLVDHMQHPATCGN